MKIETILSPQELPALRQRNWHGTACVVFDILRATSTFVTALQNGAKEIIPVSEISEAVALRQKRPEVLLAGERNGVKIRAAQSGGTDFDFGNSPREFTLEKIRGKTVVSTTTNGTRALRACEGAETILASSFLNLTATAKFLHQKNFTKVLLVCAGTGDGVALEDVLAAGALAAELLPHGIPCPAVSDSTEVALRTYAQAKSDLAATIHSSQNAQRLLAIPELHGDVAFCLQRDVFDIVAQMDANDTIRLL